MKFKIYLTIAIVLLICGGIFLWKMGVFQSRERVSVVEDTPNIVEAVEQIQELCTEYYYDEVTLTQQEEKKGVSAAATNVVNSVVETGSSWVSKATTWLTGKSDEKEEKKEPAKPAMSNLAKELVVIVKVTCRVGWNLQEILDSDGMKVCGDTLFIDLPEAKFIETIVNPTDINIFVEDGEWEFPTVLQSAVNDAKRQVEQRAIADGIIEKADASGRKILTSLFSTMGFKVFFIDELPESINLNQPSETPSQKAESDTIAGQPAA